MSEEEGGVEASSKPRANQQASTGSYILRPLVQNIPLSTEEHTEQARITCVELCDDNLYIGTSQAEILHFVAIPPDSAGGSSSPTYIFASRLQPAYNAQSPTQALVGVQQILVLSKVQKACILCNGTLSFYSLPELSPAFNNTTVSNCTWVGGVDLTNDIGEQESGVVVMICVKNRVRLVKICDEARKVRDIEYPGCLAASRRGDFACVADAHSYALLDVENQQKISLFPISSLENNAAGGKVEDISSKAGPADTRNRSFSRPVSRESVDGKGHGRSTSLGTFVGGLGRRQDSPQKPGSRDRSGLTTPEPHPGESSSLLSPSHSRTGSTSEPQAAALLMPEKSLPPPPRSDSLRPPPTRPQTPLLPHICSPTPIEFLLTTGTGAKEPGVGIFVNLDGDVVRGTLQFSQYPTSVVVDGIGIDTDATQASSDEDREGFVLSAVNRPGNNGERSVVEIQRWDVENGGVKEWMEIPRPAEATAESEPNEVEKRSLCGLRKVQTIATIPFPEIGEVLRSKRLRFTRDLPKKEEQVDSPLEQWEMKRNQEEMQFSRRLGIRSSHLTLYSDNTIWWVIRNPLVLRLDTVIDKAIGQVANLSSSRGVDRSRIIQVVNSIRGHEPTTETDFLSLEYIRQKTSLILFADLLTQQSEKSNLLPADLRITEDLLIEGGLDPRVILYLDPRLREEIIEGTKGLWIHAGLIPVTEQYKSEIDIATSDSPQSAGILSMIKRFLTSWRQRKGFGSIADETEVFQTVDAALLCILLMQDQKSASRSPKPSPERAELYAFVDSGVDCFDRAVDLLEKQHRLYVLSRLYQSRRMARKVLSTWKRIIEGERDDGGGLFDGENEARRYLVNIKDTGLVEEYGTWLARRNSKLGVQVFTNDNSRVKWEPHQVVMLLRRKAPDAVKDYLEHLVFGKKNFKYANDLISYYLDSVLTVLGSSDEARSILAQSYQSYRALHPPKPTYRQFIIENSLDLPWWHDRLRLLELIGGSHGSDFSYDVSQVLARIEPFEEDLVPESIILDGRQGRHKQALRLLTHGLGDYHTAINYCLLGGASIFHPTSGSVSALVAPSQEEQAILFGYLLTEFLRIEDTDDRLERTSELLGRFGSWYDARSVLDQIPESWSVELVSGFLVSAFRRLVHEKNEAMITKALSGAENLQVASAFVEKCMEAGPQIESIQSAHE